MHIIADKRVFTACGAERAIMVLPGLRRGIALVLFIAVTGATASVAQDGPWTERRYDPPAGSKWQIVSKSTTVENRPGTGNRDEQLEIRADLTIDEKLPEGFRITYINRSFEVGGSTPVAKLLGNAYGAMTDIPIRGRLDAAGRPVAVENLAEVKASMRKVIDGLAAKFESNPKAAAFVRQVMQSVLDAEGRDAAAMYFEELAQLAEVQNIGLRPGAVRKENESRPSPFGTNLKTVLTTRLDSYDDRAGTARFLRKREFDKDSLHEAVTELAGKLAPLGDNKTITPAVIELMKKIDFSIEGETVYNVDNGMTTWIDDREFIRASVAGTTVTKQRKKTVTVRKMN
jgi:hypothetical protein